MSDPWSWSCNICPGGGGQAGVGGNGHSTNNWWDNRNCAISAQPALGGIRCAWCFLWQASPPFNASVKAYRPKVDTSAWDAGFRYPPRIPGAPGNAGETALD